MGSKIEESLEKNIYHTQFNIINIDIKKINNELESVIEKLIKKNGKESVKDIIFKWQPNIVSEENNKFDYKKIINKLDNITKIRIIIEYNFSKLGNSIAVVGDEKLINVHVHTDHPNKVIEYVFKKMSNEIRNIDIENMKEQYEISHGLAKKTEQIRVSTKDFNNLYGKIQDHNKEYYDKYIKPNFGKDVGWINVELKDLENICKRGYR